MLHCISVQVKSIHLLNVNIKNIHSPGLTTLLWHFCVMKDREPQKQEAARAALAG